MVEIYTKVAPHIDVYDWSNRLHNTLRYGASNQGTGMQKMSNTGRGHGRPLCLDIFQISLDKLC